MTTEPLVSAAWLKARLTSPGLRVIDASWYMPGTPRDPDAEFLERHIPGAVRFNYDEIADRSSGLPHMLPSPAEFATAVSALGIGSDNEVVVYAADGIAPAARVWWMFRVMGHNAVHVLDGGLPQWLAAHGPMEAGPARPQPAPYMTRFRPELVKSFEQVGQILADKSAQVLDARGASRFSGEAPEPRAGLRSGHMPGARNTPFTDLLDTNGTMKPVAELEKTFIESGVKVSDPIVTSCGSGVTAAVVALALARMGHWDTAIYDGSWTEWGGRADADVVTGPA